MNFLSWFEPDGNNTHVDHIFTASVILLTGWGLVTLYSASYYQAQRFFNNGLFFFSRQAILGICGIFLFLILSRINLQLFRKLIPFMVIGTLFICCLTFIPGLGVEKNGATRWIGIGRSSQNPSEPGITFQPSELIKLVMPFYLAHIFSKKGDSLNDFKRGILPPAIVLTVFFIIVYRQNNFSTAVFIALNALVIFFLAGVQKRWFAGAFIMLT
ncbi:MAG: FtsW/RodA/SpoVE family cell cycle protein, partial [Treponema sp.]|nr:FtsW/RodA/SpoVE family cell cycle protein [Treponema sp.]